MHRVAILLISLLSVFTAAAKAQTPLTNAFTYQGELASDGTPATGTYDFRFRLFEARENGSQFGSTLCSDNLSVSAGRFTVTLDFGPGIFDGGSRFLEIEVRSDAGLGCADDTDFTMLSRRQELTAVPHATFAQNAATATNAIFAQSALGATTAATATFAQNAATATNATSLNGQSPSFYQNAANLTGTLPDARLSTNVARLNSNQTFTGLLNFSNPSNTFVGNGAGLTNINGANIAAGTIARSSLSADVQSGVGTIVPDLSLAGIATTQFRPISVAVSGSFAYVVNRDSNSLQVFNISNPATPILAGSAATGSGPEGVALAGSFAYVVNQDSNSLQVFNISNPTTPTLTGSVVTSQPTSIAVSGSFAYVVSLLSNTLQVVNVSNPAAPTLMGSVATSFPRSIAVSGSIAYVANDSSDRLQVFNISNPNAPTLATSVLVGGNPIFVTVSGSFAYVANYSANTLQVFNISSPLAPVLVGSVVTAGTPYSVAVSGSVAYVINLLAESLQTFNISNPAAPTLMATVGTGNVPYSVAVSGALACVVNRDASTMQVFRTLGVDFVAPLAASSLTGVNGSGLTGVNAARLNGQAASFYTNASNITTGTLADSRLSSNIALKNAANAFTSTGVTSFAGNVGIGTTASSQRLTVAGNLSVTGSVSKGGGSFKIDHPLDPENKYLYHSFVESPDMMNIYNGEATTDDTGYAVITLPDYFEALNRDFRYQLTVIDEDDQTDVVLWAKVVRRIGAEAANTFTIRTFRPSVTVSWQVTGIRKDAWAEKNRIPNTVDKPASEKGKYLHPEAFDKPTSQGISSPAAESQSTPK